MASGDPDSPQRRSLPPTAPASPVCSGDKSVLPSDLMNLNDAEMVQLFEPGQQNGLFERYYQDVRGTITSTSSCSLANESLESLIQDLDELSQPEVFMPVAAAAAASVSAGFSDNIPGKEPAVQESSESIVSSTNMDSNEIDSPVPDSFAPDSSVVECVTALTSVVVEETQLVLVKQSQQNICVAEGSTAIRKTFTEVDKEAEVDSTVLLVNSSDEKDRATSRDSKRQCTEGNVEGAGVSSLHSTVPFKVRKVAMKKKRYPFGNINLTSCELGVNFTPLVLKTVEIRTQSAEDGIQVEPKNSVKSLSEYFEGFVVNENPEPMAQFGRKNTEIEVEVFRVVDKIVEEVSTVVKSLLDSSTLAPLSEQQCCNSELEKNSTGFASDADMHPVQSLSNVESEVENDCSIEISKSHKCSICSLKFVRLVNLSRHMSSHVEKEVFCCDNCDLIFNSSEDLVAHNTKLHDYSDGYVCKICNFKVATQLELEEHVGSHLNQEALNCGECHSKFKRYSEFCLHSSQHTGEKVFKCATCQCLFRSKRDLHAHESFSHSIAPENIEKSFQMDKFQCEKCGELFDKLGAFNLHMSGIHGNWQPTCATCGRSFPKLKSLRTHWLRTHMNKPATEKKLSMPEKKQSTLERKQQPAPEKMQFQSEKKQSLFECSECERTFHTSAVFLRHMSSHKKARQSSLKAKFKIKVSSLSYKEGNFLCDICFAPFSRVSDLKKHIASMHVCEDKKYVRSCNSHTTSLRKKLVNLRGSEPGLILENSYSMQNSVGLVLESNNNAIEVKTEVTYPIVPDEDTSKTVYKTNKLILCNPYGESEAFSTVDGSLDSEPLIDHLCGQCSMSFNNHIEFILHKQLHPLPSQCFVCKSSFLIETDLYSHICITSN